MISRLWAVFFGLIAFVFCALYVRERQRIPQETVIEVEKLVEVPKEVIREVKVEIPRDVIREVPVEVIREVEKPLTESQTMSIDIAQRIISAKRVFTKEDILAGIGAVRVVVGLSDTVKQVVGEEGVRNRIELIFRRNGVKIDPEAPYIAYVNFDGFWDTDRVQMTYSVQHGVAGSVYSARDGVFRIFQSEIWSAGSYGYAGSQKIQEVLMSNSEEAAEALANALLAAREVK